MTDSRPKKETPIYIGRETVKPVPTRYPRFGGGKSIDIGNNHCHLLKSPVNQLRSVSAQNGTDMASEVKKPEVSMKVCTIFQFGF